MSHWCKPSKFTASFYRREGIHETSKFFDPTCRRLTQFRMLLRDTSPGRQGGGFHERDFERAFDLFHLWVQLKLNKLTPMPKRHTGHEPCMGYPNLYKPEFEVSIIPADIHLLVHTHSRQRDTIEVSDPSVPRMQVPPLESTL